MNDHGRPGRGAAAARPAGRGPERASVPDGAVQVRRLAVVTTVLVAAGLAPSAAAAGPAGSSAGAVRAGGGAAGRVLECGGIQVGRGQLPGRPIGSAERAGPAEGIAQLLRLSEWSRNSPYQRASWSVVDAGPDRALLVATGPRSAYVPVYRGPDGHWQIGAPCP